MDSEFIVCSERIGKTARQRNILEGNQEKISALINVRNIIYVGELQCI